MVCNNCGAELPEGSVTCAKCGAGTPVTDSKPADSPYFNFNDDDDDFIIVPDEEPAPVEITPGWDCPEDAVAVPREIAESCDFYTVGSWLKYHNKNGVFAAEQGTTVLNLGGKYKREMYDWESGDHGCGSCDLITSFYIPDSVTTIGLSAFEYCSSLTSIEIPHSVTKIGNNAFKYCGSLTSITLPDSLTTISDCTFYYCTSLTSIAIPNSVTKIYDSAFYYCTSLTSVAIPDSVTTIECRAFEYCTSLTSIRIPESVTEISFDAFAGCRSLY